MAPPIPASVKWGGIGLFVGSILLLPATLFSRSPDPALWFIALLVVITAALTLTAIVFGGLNLSNPGEAFGLPSGSVRTLLAVGVMVMFSVFGLKFFADANSQGLQPALSDKPLVQVEVEADRLTQEVERYERETALKAVVLSPGRAASGAEAAVLARVSLYAMERRLSPQSVDVQKQLLTAIITLLTTVIGFYFGSKSATEGLQRRPPKEPPPGNGTGTGTNTRDGAGDGAASGAENSAGDGAADSAAGSAGESSGIGPQRDALRSEGEALEADISASRALLTQLQALPAASDPATTPAVADALSKALDANAQLDALLQAYQASFALAQDKVAALAAATPGPERRALGANAQRALGQARQALEAAQQGARTLTEGLEFLRKLTAVG